MPWLSSGWFVGIITSLIAGGLISLVSWLALSKRQREEFLQRVFIANREVIYAIRPGIAEGHVPTADVLDAMANATARKYELERKDLYSPPELTDELIKEVMDSSFLSSGQKKEYCAQLTPLRQQPVVKVQVRDSDPYAEKMVTIMSMVLGIVSVTLSFGLQRLGFLKKLDGVVDHTQSQIFVAMAVFATMVAILATYFWLGNRQKIKYATDRINDASKKIREVSTRLGGTTKP
jgi:hypothetical protein